MVEKELLDNIYIWQSREEKIVLLLLNEYIGFNLLWEYGASNETIKPFHTPHPIHLG